MYANCYSAQIESHSHVKYARFEKRYSKRYVTPINKRMHCILICFTWQVLVHMFSSEYVYVVVFIQQKDSKRRLCEVSARICTRYAQRHQLAKAFSKALACEVVAAKTSATHTHIRALIYVNNMVALSHRHRRLHAQNSARQTCAINSHVQSGRYVKYRYVV